MPRWSPGKSRQRSGKAPVLRNSAETHRGYPGNRPQQSYGRATATPRFNRGCRR
ncbi:hypothetical protein DPMN_105165 [Dreissena polymorpha]|uniref:Uncharacterized protein n=1 Tax=Dreissena polymorpha TaxID=45954 RepID=A0A9D4HB40_DREPO|nr:hypothetical protein DPMN_105165 [Dreissena polymorpha]